MADEDLKARVEALEAALARYEQLFASFAAGPGKKIAAMLGIDLRKMTQ